MHAYTYVIVVYIDGKTSRKAYNAQRDCTCVDNYARTQTWHRGTGETTVDRRMCIQCHLYIHTFTHAYIHTYIHTYIHMNTNRNRNNGETKSWRRKHTVSARSGSSWTREASRAIIIITATTRQFTIVITVDTDTRRLKWRSWRKPLWLFSRWLLYYYFGICDGVFFNDWMCWMGE